MAPKPVARIKRRERKNIVNAIVYVNATFNNTIITIADYQGNVISWSSAGTVGFKHSRKSTPYAAQIAAEDAVRKAKEHGVAVVVVIFKGPGSGRETALRALQSAGLEVTKIMDKSPLAHNGVRASKERRV